MNLKPSVMIMTVFLVLTVSCAKEYTYSPPASEAGKACVSQCQNKQSACRQAEVNTISKKKELFEIAEQKKFEQCEHDAKIAFKACRDYAPTLEHRGLCEEKVCLKGYFAESVSYEFCDSEFRNCFQQCGGTIGVME